MRLLLVELNRFRSRRAIALIVLGAVLFAAFLAVSTIWDTRPLSAGDHAAAQAQVDAEIASPGFKRELANCERDPEQYMGPDATADQCAEMMTPQVDWYLQRQPLRLDMVRGDTGLAVVVITAALMVIAGTTFAGADWSTGSMSNQLLFEPRRLKVWLAKAGAVFLATLLVSAVVVTAFWVTIYLVAESRGIPTAASVQESIRWMAGRGVLLTGLGAAGGYAVTMLLRHTVGTLAMMFGYAIGGEALISALPINHVGRWSLGNNVLAWLNDGHKYWDQTLPCAPNGDCDRSVLLPLSDAVAYLGVLLAVVMVLSMLLFRRRDIA